VQVSFRKFIPEKDLSAADEQDQRCGYDMRVKSVFEYAVEDELLVRQISFTEIRLVIAQRFNPDQNSGKQNQKQDEVGT